MPGGENAVNVPVKAGRGRSGVRGPLSVDGCRVPPAIDDGRRWPYSEHCGAGLGQDTSLAVPPAADPARHRGVSGSAAAAVAVAAARRPLADEALRLVDEAGSLPGSASDPELPGQRLVGWSARHAWDVLGLAGMFEEPGSKRPVRKN